MNVTVNNRLAFLIDEKRKKEHRNITLSEVSQATKISRRALYAWVNNEVKRIDVHVIDALCKYFDVNLVDLFEYIEDTPPPKKKK